MSIFLHSKWKFLLGQLMESLGIDNILENTLLRSVFVYYCKQTLKNKAEEFFSLWNPLLSLKSSDLYKESDPKKEPEYNKLFEKVKPYAKTILNLFDLYSIGRFLRRLLIGYYFDDSLAILTTLLNSEKLNKNYTKDLFNFIDGLKVSVANEEV